MYSMTGFASHNFKSENGYYYIKIKSLNSRFLDLKIHLPSSLEELEEDIRKQIRSSISRAKVDLQIHFKKTGTKKYEELYHNKLLTKEIVKRLKSIAKEQGLKMQSMQDLLSVYNPISIESKAITTKKEKEALLKGLNRCLDKLNTKRKKEGQATVAEIKKLLLGIKKSLKKIEELRKKSVKKIAEKYKVRVKKILANNVDSQRVYQELALLIDKNDIHEEIIRLKEHIKSFQTLFTENNGKKMDFYTQELLRETNTIGSKAQDAEITSAIVDIKCNVERIREVVQNLE